MFDDFLIRKYSGELLVVRSAGSYNTATGALAQHYFYKDAHRWSYMSVLHDYLVRKREQAEYEGSLCKRHK